MTVTWHSSKNNASGQMRATREESARLGVRRFAKTNETRTFVADLVRTLDVYTSGCTQPREIPAPV